MAKAAVKLTKAMERTISGESPKNITLDKISTTYAHSYMSRYYDSTDSIEFLCEYLNKNNMKELAVKLKKIPSYTLPITSGWIAKYLLDGCVVMESSMDYLNSSIQMIRDYIIPEKKSSEGGSKYSVDNQNIMFTESVLDDILVGKTVDFDATSYFRSNELSAVSLKKIKDYYDGCYDQLIDPNNKEYFNHSSSIKKALLKFYKDIEDSIDVILNNKARERKPRKTKTKPASKVVSLLRFMPVFKELNITSISPDRVVTSESVVLYNTKNKVLTILHAPKGQKLSAHRTAITNIDTEKSVQKTLRKPEINLPKFTSGTKPSMNRVFKELTTVEKKVDSFYTNEHTILLRCF